MLPPCENYDACRSYGVFTDGYKEKAFCPQCYAQRKGINIGSSSTSKSKNKAKTNTVQTVRERVHQHV